MSTRVSDVAGRVAVIGGLHSWPLLRAYFDEVVAVPDPVEDHHDAEYYVDTEHGPTVLGPVQRAMDGFFDDFSAIILDRDHATTHLYLQEFHRRGLLPLLPPMHVFDVVVDEGAAVRRYDRDEVDRLRAFCERVTARPWDADRLSAELAAESRLSEALRAVQDRRRAGRLRGSVAKAALAARRQQAPLAVAESLAALPEDVLPGPRIAVVPTASAPRVDFHELVESVGGVVVAEDDWYGSRSIPAAADAVSGDVLDRVLDDLLASAATDRISPMSRRLDWVRGVVGDGPLDALVILTDPDDPRRGWDAPHLRRVAGELGLKVIDLHGSLGDPVFLGEVRGRLAEEFAASESQE